MRTQKTHKRSPARTLLKSTSHVRVNDKKGNYFRSVAVGLQFLLFLPHELIRVVIWPFIRNIVIEVIAFLDGFFFVILGAFSAILTGFSGYLEATDEPIDID